MSLPVPTLKKSFAYQILHTIQLFDFSFSIKNKHASARSSTCINSLIGDPVPQMSTSEKLFLLHDEILFIKGKELHDCFTLHYGIVWLVRINLLALASVICSILLVI